MTDEPAPTPRRSLAAITMALSAILLLVALTLHVGATDEGITTSRSSYWNVDRRGNDTILWNAHNLQGSGHITFGLRPMGPDCFFETSKARIYEGARGHFVVELQVPPSNTTAGSDGGDVYRLLIPPYDPFSRTCLTEAQLPVANVTLLVLPPGASANYSLNPGAATPIYAATGAAVFATTHRLPDPARSSHPPELVLVLAGYKEPENQTLGPVVEARAQAPWMTGAHAGLGAAEAIGIAGLLGSAVALRRRRSALPTAPAPGPVSDAAALAHRISRYLGIFRALVAVLGLALVTVLIAFVLAANTFVEETIRSDEPFSGWNGLITFAYAVAVAPVLYAWWRGFAAVSGEWRRWKTHLSQSPLGELGPRHGE